MVHECVAIIDDPVRSVLNAVNGSPTVDAVASFTGVNGDIAGTKPSSAWAS